MCTACTKFILNYEGTPSELVEKDKYLGMFINSNITWDFHVQRFCQNMYYPLSLLRRLRSIFPRDLLLQVYKGYIKPRLDYGITLYGYSTQKNIDLVQRVQNHAARLVTGNFDYVNCRGLDLVRLWHDLPEFVQNSSDIKSFKCNYKMHKRIISP